MKKFILITLCLLLITIQTSFAAKRINYKTDIQWSNEGLYNMNNERYVKAANDFSKAIEIDPNQPLYYYQRGMAYLHAMNFPLAYQDFNQATLLDESDVTYLVAKIKANLFLTKHANDEIITDLDKAIKLSSNDASLFNYRGKAYATIDNHDKAIGDYNIALSLSPDNLLSLIYRAESYIALGEYDLAETDLKKAFDYAPKNPLVYYTLGQLYKKQQQIDWAIDNFNKAIDLDNKYPDPYFAKAQIYGEYTEPGQRLIAINNYKLFIEYATANTNLDYCLSDYKTNIAIAEQKIPELHK